MTNDRRALDATVALVTGASSGIGRATALQLSAHGATVALVARRRPQLEQLVADIERAGGRAIALAADITDESAARDVVADAVSDLGRLDILVNNAGVMLLGAVTGADISQWHRMVDVNIRGLLTVTHAAMAHLRTAAQSEPRRVSDLVNVGSVAGRVARAGGAVYSLTKWGVGAFSEALRQEVTTEYVRVSLIAPGGTDTELLSHNTPDVCAAAAVRMQGVERLAAADVAEAITYVVTRPRNVAINEVVIRPTTQSP